MSDEPEHPQAVLSSQGWQTVRLGDLVALQRGHDLTWRERRVGNVPVLGSAGINGYHDRALAAGPGVVLGRSGASFGVAHYSESIFWPHNTALYVTDFHGNFPRYIYYLLSSTDFSRHNTGGAQQSLNRNFIAPIELGIPSVNEQISIATALDDVNNCIRLIERLVAKKRAIKQGMMQELLTGRTRLPGFDQSWQSVKLGDVCAVDPETVSADLMARDLEIDYISLEDVSRGKLLGWTRVGFGAAPSRARRALQVDDILFGTVRPNLQSHTKYSGGLRHPVASTGFAVIRAATKLVSPSFIAHWVLSGDVSDQVDRIIAGSNYPAISSVDVRLFDLLLPPYDEQEAIGKAINDADAEIEALERLLESTRAIKQGMMQELLTGRTRLPVGATQ